MRFGAREDSARDGDMIVRATLHVRVRGNVYLARVLSC